MREGADGLKKTSPFRFIAESGLEASTKHTGLLGNVDLNEWITMSIQRAIDNVQSRTQDGLAFLATVGSTAPFVGLFGTVWGIYHALTAIGIAGQASIDKVAGPVGEALIMTAFGLAVAVPAVLGYNWLIRRNKAAMDTVRSFGADLHAVLLSAPANLASQGVNHVDERRPGRWRRGRDRLGDQHHAAGRCDAGAADHLSDHHSGGDHVRSRSQLPKESNEIRETKPENITISVDAQARIYWNELRIDTNAALIDRLKKIAVLEAAARSPDPRRRRRELRVGRAASSTPASGQASRRSASSPSRRFAAVEMPAPVERRRNPIMAMNVGSRGSGEPDVMMDINTTPLIDVMLVLLVMLIITIPDSAAHRSISTCRSAIRRRRWCSPRS